MRSPASGRRTTTGTVATKGKRFRSVQIGPRLVATLPAARRARRTRRPTMTAGCSSALPHFAAATPGAPSRPTQSQDRARLARVGAGGRRPARHAAARAPPHGGDGLARHRASADLRPAPARASLDHDDRGALRAPRVLLRAIRSGADGGADRVRGPAPSARETVPAATARALCGRLGRRRSPAGKPDEARLLEPAFDVLRYEPNRAVGPAEPHAGNSARPGSLVDPRTRHAQTTSDLVGLEKRDVRIGHRHVFVSRRRSG